MGALCTWAICAPSMQFRLARGDSGLMNGVTFIVNYKTALMSQKISLMDYCPVSACHSLQPTATVYRILLMPSWLACPLNTTLYNPPGTIIPLAWHMSNNQSAMSNYPPSKQSLRPWRQDPPRKMQVRELNPYQQHGVNQTTVDFPIPSGRLKALHNRNLTISSCYYGVPVRKKSTKQTTVIEFHKVLATLGNYGNCSAQTNTREPTLCR